MNALRASMLRVGVTVTIGAGLLGCGGKGPLAREGVPARRASISFEANRRLAVTYMQLEMWWVFKGRYPKSLQSLIEKSPGCPLDPLDAEAILDPYSSHGFPFRYRVTTQGAELASVGPDRRWGGWGDTAVSFFIQDDIRITPQNVYHVAWRYMHSMYCQAVAEEALKWPVVSVQSSERQAPLREEAVRDWIPEKALHADSPEDLLRQMVQRWGLRAAIDKGELGASTIGFETWAPGGPELGQVSLQTALSALQEATPMVLEVFAWKPPSILLTSHEPPVAEAFAFWELMAQEDYMRLLPKIEHTASGPEDIVLLLPSAWFHENAATRMNEALSRLFGSERQAVFPTSTGIAISRIPSWSDAFLLLNQLREFVPDRASSIRALEEIRRLESKDDVPANGAVSPPSREDDH